MSSDQYLTTILNREAVDTSANSSVRLVQGAIAPLIAAWAGNALVGVSPSGSFAKGTANRSGTDIDLFISLSHETTTTLKGIYDSLFNALTNAKYSPRRQNVSLNIKVGGVDVDLVPAKRQDAFSQDHSLYRRRADTWTKTNVAKHVAHVRAANRLQETRILKLWRNQKGLDFLSFYLELTVIAALENKTGSLSQNVWAVFQYLRDDFVSAKVVDPANTNNVISDDLTAAEKAAIKSAAVDALSQKFWEGIVK